MQILLLVQQDHWLTAVTLADCQAQTIVQVESFGSGTLIRALQALRRWKSYLDPRLQERLRQMPISLTGREDHVLRGVSRGLSNKAIAGEMGIADTTVRDGGARRLPGRMATRKPMPRPCISGRFSIPWYPASA